MATVYRNVPALLRMGSSSHGVMNGLLSASSAKKGG